jgi:type I restriction enzyme R subunit
VGVVEHPKVDTQTLERKRTVPFPKLLEAVALGVTDDDTLASLAGRLAKLEARLAPADMERLAALLLPGVASLADLAERLVDATDPDRIYEWAVRLGGVFCRGEASGDDILDSQPNSLPDASPLQWWPSDEQLAAARAELVAAAVQPIAANPELRAALVEMQLRSEQVIDTLSIDRVLAAAYSPEATEKSRQLVDSFREYIEAHKDEITVLQLIFNQPYGLRRVSFQQVKELAEQLEQPPHQWSTRSLWLAYAHNWKRTKCAG